MNNINQILRTAEYNDSFENSIGYNNYAVRMERQRFENNELKVSRSADQFKPLYVKSNNPIDYLILEIGGTAIIKFPLKFCNRIFPPIDFEDCYMYSIPFDKFNMKYIPIVCLQFQEVKFIIISNQLCEANLYLECKYLNDELRRNLINQISNLEIRQYQEQNILLNENVNNTLLNFQGNVTGIFVDHVNLNELTQFKLILNDYISIDFDKVQLRLFTKKLDDECFYIPFNDLDFHNNLFNDNSMSSSIDFNRFQNVSVEFKSNIEQDIKIRTFSHNLLIVRNGLSGLAFTSADQAMDNQFSQEVFGINTRNYISNNYVSRTKEQNKLIEYNHCGKYYVHYSCLNTWTHDECLICREKISNSYNSYNSYNTFSNLPSTSSIVINVTENNIETEENEARNRCYKIVIFVNLIGIGIILMTNYI